MSFGTTPLSTTVLSTNTFPVSAVYVPNTSGGNFTALAGGPALSADTNGNISAPVLMYLNDNFDVAQGSLSDAAVTGDVAGTISAKLRGLSKIFAQLQFDGSNFLKVNVAAGSISATQSGTWNINNISGTISLPTGAAQDATVAKLNIAQSTALGTNTGPLIQGSVTTSSPTYTTGNINPLSLTTAGALRIDGTATTQPVSAVSLPLPTGAATSAKQPALGTAGSASSDVLTVQGIASMTALKVDGSAVTQPVSGTITANIGTSGSLALDTSVNGILLSQGSTTSGEKGPLIQGAVTTNAPSYTTAQTSPLSLDTTGLLRVSLKDTPANANNLNVALAASSATVTVTASNLQTNLNQIAGSAIATAATGIAKVGLTDGSGNAITSTSNAIDVNIKSGGGSGFSVTDESAWTAGTSAFVPTGGVYNDTATALTSGQEGAIRLTNNRAIHSNIRNSSGTELATSSNPLRIDPTGTTTQPVSGTVTSNIGTTNGLALDTSVNGILVSQGSTTSGEKGPMIQGAVTTGAPTYTNAQTSPISLTTAGAVRIDGSAVTQPVSGTITANAGTGTFNIQSNASVNVNQVSGSAIATAATGIMKVGLTDGSGNALTSTSNALNVNIASGGGSGFSVVDEAAWTAGTSAFVPAGGVFNDSAAALTSGQQGSIRLTNNRAIHVNLRDASANQLLGSKTSANSIPVVIASDQSAFPVSQSGSNWTVNVAQIAGSSTATAATGVQKVGIVGNSGATVDSTVGAGTAPTNAIIGGSIYNSSAPAPTAGQAMALQADQAGNIRTFPGVALTTLSVWNSSTSLNTTQTIFTNSGGPAVLVQLDQTTTITGGAITFEVTFDGTIWITAPAVSVLDPTSITFAQISLPYTLQASTNKPFIITSSGWQGLRIKLSTQISGTGTVTPYYALLAYDPIDSAVVFSPTAANFNVSAVQSGTWTIQPGNTANTTPWLATINQGGNSATVTASNALKVDGSAVTQPISGTVTANVGTTNGLALDTSVNGILLAQGSTTSGQKGSLVQGAVTTAAPSYTTAQTSPLSLDTSGLLRASLKDTPSNTNNLNVNIAASAATVTVSGTVTANQGGSNWSTNVAQIGGTNIVTGGASGLIAVGGPVASGASNADNPLKIGGAFNTTQPTVTTGQVVDAQMTARGAQIVATGTDTFNVTVNAALPAGSATIGAVTQASGPWTNNITQVAGSAISLGSKTSANSFPVVIASDQGAVSVQHGNVVDSNNSSTATLTANSVFTGTSTSSLNYSTLSIEVFADQASAANGLSIQQSQNGTNWDTTDTFSVSASIAFNTVVNLVGQFYRVVYTNGGTGQGTFRLQTVKMVADAVLPRTLTALGNLKSAIQEALPTGTNQIGSMTIAGAAATDPYNATVFVGGELRVQEEPSLLFLDDFSAGTIDTTNRWKSPASGGGGIAATNSVGSTSIGSGTTANGYSYLESQPTFPPANPGWLMIESSINMTFPYVANTYHFWGIGTSPATPTAAAPLTEAVGFEIAVGGKMYAICYATGTRNQIQDLSSATGNSKQPTDSSVHIYTIYFRGDRVYWCIDGLDNVVASMLTGANGPNVNTLPIKLASIAGTSAPASSSTITINQTFMSDTTHKNFQLSDGLYPWRKATVKAANIAPTLADLAVVNTLSPVNTGLPVNTPAIVQKVANKSTGSVASLAQAFSSNNTAGNSIIVECAVGNGTAPTISDTNSNTYTQAVQVANSTTLNTAIFYAVNVASGANTVTVNNGGTTASIAMEIYEVSGLIAQVTAQPDQTASAIGTSGTAATSVISALTPNEYAFACIGIGTAAQTITAGSGWTNDSGQQNPTTPAGLFSFVSMSQYLGSLKSVTPQATFTSEPWAIAVATFRPVILGIEGTINLAQINGTTLSNTNPVPVQDIEQSGYVSASSPPSTTNAGSDTTYTFTSQVNRVIIQNNTSANANYAFDTAASAGSLLLVPGAMLVYPKKCTALHLYTAAAQTINGSSAGNLVVLGAL